MKKEVYESVVSKLSTAMPLFAKAALDISLRKRGRTVDSLTPLEMLQILELDIDPMLKRLGKSFRAVLLAGAAQIQTNDQDEFVYLNSPAKRLVTVLCDSTDPVSQFKALHSAGFLKRANDVVELQNGEVIEERTGRYFNVSWSPLFDVSGNRTGVCAVIQDFSLLQSIEAELRSSYEIILTQQEKLIAAARLSTLGEMASGIGHEINNPLTAILLKSQYLQKRLTKGGISADEFKDGLDQIVATGRRIEHIIRGLRTLARDGTQDPFTETHVSKVVEETLALCRERFNANGVRLDVKPIPAGLRFTGHPTEISQVLLNLLSNSFDAVESLPEKWTQIETADEGETLTISVTDSGKGIPEHIAARMMEPFFSTKPSQKGTGLGLSISERIAVAHGGSLVLDRKSKNTRIVLRLPKFR